MWSCCWQGWEEASLLGGLFPGGMVGCGGSALVTHKEKFRRWLEEEEGVRLKMDNKLWVCLHFNGQMCLEFAGKWK